MRLFTPPNNDDDAAGFCGENMVAATTVGAIRDDIDVCSVRFGAAVLVAYVAARCVEVSMLEHAAEEATKAAGTF
jgi:hypothetical protein